MMTLPLDIQSLMLADVLDFSVWTGEEVQEILDYARQLHITKNVSPPIRGHFFSALAKRMFLSLDLEKAQEILANIPDPVQAQKLQGWLLFLQDQPDKAIAAFESALQTLRKEHKSKTAFFRDECGLIYILSLLKLQDKDALQTSRSLIDQAQYKQNTTVLFRPAYTSLSAVLKSLDMKPDGAWKILQEGKSSLDILAQWIIYLAHFWVENSLSSLQQEQLHNKLQKVQGNGMDWLVLEFGALLEKSEQNPLSQREHQAIKKIKKQTALTPMVNILQPEESWRQALHALQHIVDNSAEEERASSTNRLVWLIEPQGGPYISLQPKLQKLNAKGHWTKGRNVALDKLFHQAGEMEFLTAEDRRVLSALQHYYSPFRGSWYAFDSLKVLPLLIGHPRLFRASDPSLPVECIQGEPELIVVQSDNGYTLSLTPELGHHSIQLIQETQTRFKVLQISSEHRRIASILGSSSFSVPTSGYEDLVKTVSSLSGLITIHSDIQGQAGNVLQVEANPQPCMLITPAGNGFRVNMTVKPLAGDVSESGPSLKPGTGQASLMAEVQGQRMQTTRDLDAEEKLAQTVEQSCPSLSECETEDRTWMIPDPETCLRILTELKELQDQDQVQVLWPEGEKLSVAKSLSLNDLQLSLREKKNWFEVDGHIDVDQETVLELKNLLQAGGSSRFVPLDARRYAALSQGLRRRMQEIAQLSEIHDKSVKMPVHSTLVLQDLEHEVGRFESDQAWTKRAKAIQKALDHTPSPPSTLKAELREYQIQGYQWLSRLARMGFGACLADDMGLGKTLQALALIVERAPQGPTLVVAPTSVCFNWLQETSRFAPTLEPILYSGKDREEFLAQVGPFTLVICSYAVLMQDAKSLVKVSWNTLVLDEAQAIKNWNAKRTQAAMNLQAGFHMATTGTPLENNLNELWTLFRFLNPGLLSSRKRFHEHFAVPIQKYHNQEQKRLLKRIIRPFILRRLKSQVMEELPARTEVTLKVRMSQDEVALYEAMRRQALENLEQADINQGQKHFRILAELTKLRQICCHPRLVFPESELPSSKLALLEEIVSELVANGHKALIFSQFVKNLHLVQERMHSLGIKYRYLDGSTPSRLREEEITAFQSGQGDVFLISLKAGGMGINLTAADYVIHLDPWWNPAVEDQAADRAHRIGQDHPVTIYRLVTEDTVEEKIIQLHAEKRDLADSLLEGSDMSYKVDAEELIELLRQDETVGEA
jgi:superfamily II DNA or RNA helicase